MNRRPQSSRARLSRLLAGIENERGTMHPCACVPGGSSTGHEHGLPSTYTVYVNVRAAQGIAEHDAAKLGVTPVRISPRRPTRRPGPVVLTGGAVALGPQIVGAPSCIRCVYTKLLRSKC